MTVDTHPIGQLVAEVMGEIDELYGENARLGVFALVAEVVIDDEDTPGVTNILYRCNDDRTWIQAGLFDAAKRFAQSGSYPLDNTEEE